MSAALLIALVMGIVQPAAQEPAAPPTLSMVRERVKAGELDVAWSLIQKIPESSEVLREGISIALSRSDVSGALQWYERLTARVPTGDHRLLGRIGALRAQQLLRDADPRVVVEACRAESLSSAKPPCIVEMRRVADDSSADIGTRLAATGVLIDTGASGAEALFQTLVGSATATHPAAAAEAVAQRPTSESLRTLSSLASSDDQQAKYIATVALIQMRKDETRSLLHQIATDRGAGAARLIAYVGLAGLGDRDGLNVVNETLPLMKGRELLETGKVLLARKDVRGAQVLRSAMESDNPLVSIEAAENLYQIDSTRAAAHIRAASVNGNPWVRAHALEATARLRLPLTPPMRRAMLDSNSWVAVRAVQATAGEVARAARSTR